MPRLSKKAAYDLLLERAKIELSSRVIVVNYANNLLLARIRHPHSSPLAKMLYFERKEDEKGKVHYDPEDPKRRAAQEFVYWAFAKMMENKDACIVSNNKEILFITLRQENESWEDTRKRITELVADEVALAEHEKRGREVDKAIFSVYRDRLDDQVEGDNEVVLAREALIAAGEQVEGIKARLAEFESASKELSGEKKARVQARIGRQKERLSAALRREKRLEERLASVLTEKRGLAASELRGYLLRDEDELPKFLG